MTEIVLSINPCKPPGFGSHDPSVAIFFDTELQVAIEEERITRTKHAPHTFPDRAIRACLDYCDRTLPEVDRIVVPYRPVLRRRSNMVGWHLQNALTNPDSFSKRLWSVGRTAKFLTYDVGHAVEKLEEKLSAIAEPVPPIETREHHRCHAASAFHYSDFEEALILTIDGRGEYDATVVWRYDGEALRRVHTVEFPNSLGSFYRAVTQFLGYIPFNGEGKVMGLAAHGQRDEDIEATLLEHVDVGPDYDVTGIRNATDVERIFGRDRKESTESFTQWERNLAYTFQDVLERIVSSMVVEYIDEYGFSKVGLSGGVALNCKLNKAVMELDAVEDVFIQPVANDAGLVLGAGVLEADPSDVSELRSLSLGPAYSTAKIESVLTARKIDFTRTNNPKSIVADRLADGDIVCWFNGRMEFGPRALGNRSILADPRSVESKNRVNRYVKHREEWRPFAPSILADHADEYFHDAADSPFMIKTFDVKESVADDIPAVIHEGDGTTRPQTVEQETCPEYYDLIHAFYERTGVPVVLNTSFNDHGEPIVMSPLDAVRDFYSMGADLLVLDGVIVEK